MFLICPEIWTKATRFNKATRCYLPPTKPGILEEVQATPSRWDGETENFRCFFHIRIGSMGRTVYGSHTFACFFCWIAHVAKMWIRCTWRIEKMYRCSCFAGSGKCEPTVSDTVVDLCVSFCMGKTTSKAESRCVNIHGGQRSNRFIFLGLLSQ